MTTKMKTLLLDQTKGRTRKYTQPSNKSSASKESSKGNSPSKTSKSSKSVTVKEPNEEHVNNMSMDAEENIVDEMGKANEHPDEQTWFNDLVSAQKDPLIFDELMATPIDFSNFAKNCLKLDKITKADLVGPVYNLLKGTCQSNIELEYNTDECYKALTDRLDWENPKGDQCPFDLSKPLPLKGRPGHLTVASEYFFNNDLEYLKSSDPEKKYATSITKTKAARYELVGIEDMIPKQWSVTKVGYDKDIERGIKHWGPKRQLFYRSQLNKFFKHDVYSSVKILSVVSVTVNKLHGYGYLEEIMDMLLFVVQHKLFHLDGDVIVDLAVALRMFTRSLIIKKRVEDVQLGVESYQKKLNITKPQKDFPRISAKEPYTSSFDPPGVVYEDLSNRKRLMRADELYKFSDGTFKKVRDTLHYRLLNFRFGYSKDMPRRKWSNSDKRRSSIMVDLIDKQMLERQILRNLERLVGARELKIDYRLMQRTI
ncbi:hypothetical protein Tco_0215420 [Tanacetum coccineum]